MWYFHIVQGSKRETNPASEQFLIKNYFAVTQFRKYELIVIFNEYNFGYTK